MTNEAKPASRLTTALLLAGLFLVLALVCCAVVAFAALILPRPASPAVTAPASAAALPQMSDLPAWLPDRNSLPGGMKLVEEKRTSNKDIAGEQDNPEEYLRKLDSFGRVEGFSREYGSTDPCRTRGMRYIKMTLILHRDGVGAQQYVDWMEATDREAENFKINTVGNYGYQFWGSPYIEECPDTPDEHMAMIFFRRGNVVGFVEVSAALGNNSDADILSVAQSIAHNIDTEIKSK